LAALLSGCTTAPEPSASPNGPLSPTAATATQTPTPTTPGSSTPTPSGTPTSTTALSADQELALSQTRGFLAALDKLGARPASKFSQKAVTEALEPYATGDIITTYLDGLRDHAEEGIHLAGTVHEVWADVAQPSRSDSMTSIEVTVCRDQRALRALDPKGNVVDKGFPDFLRYGFEMRGVDDGVFKVWHVTNLGESCDQ
jgi:hypothetical protein